MVPKGWLEIRIENCLKDKNSMAYGILQPGDDIAGGIPMLRTVDIDVSGLIGSKVICVTKELHDEYSRTALNGGEVLLSVMGTIGRTIVVPESCSGWNVNRALAVIRLKSDIDPFYFCEYLKSPFINDRLVEQAIGSAQKRINLGDLRKYIVRIPPYQEQRKIAQILSIWDKAITTTERLLTNRQQQKKALMQRLLTGKQRFAGFEGEWKEYSVSQIGKVITGSTPSKSEEANYGSFISWATAEDFKGKYVRDTNIKLSIEGAKKARLVSKGSVLVTCIASIGKNAIAAEQLATNQQINSVEINQHHSNEFFYYLIEFNKHILIALSGSTAVPILNKSSFEKIKFKVPLLQEQQKIAAILSAADTEITTIQNQLDNLKQQKKALMQQLLTGKRRVKVDSPALATQ